MIMPGTSLVIQNPRDLESAINKAITFSGLTLLLIVSALTGTILLALKKHEELSEVGSFLLLTSPFIIHGIQLFTTIIVLIAAKKNPQNLTMGKCRFWSVTSRVLTAPILIEMMILIGYKWYLTIIAIPLVIMYFMTMLQVEKIMHYFFTKNLSSRLPLPVGANRGHGVGATGGGLGADEILFFEYPFNLEINSSFYRLSSRHSQNRRIIPSDPTNSAPGNSHLLPIPYPIDQGPPTYSEATTTGSSSFYFKNEKQVHEDDGTSRDESPPPEYLDIVKEPLLLQLQPSTTATSGSSNGQNPVETPDLPNFEKQ